MRSVPGLSGIACLEDALHLDTSVLLKLIMSSTSNMLAAFKLKHGRIITDTLPIKKCPNSYRR